MDDAPSLTVVRPQLEEFIAEAGPARSDEAASKAARSDLRTGTDDVEITLEDLLHEDDSLSVALLPDEMQDSADFFGLAEEPQ